MSSNDKRGAASLSEKSYKGGSASGWVKDRMVTEAMEAASAHAPEESRQLTVRLHPVIAALFEGFADRFKMSRNNAVNVLLACALVDALQTLPKAEQAAMLKRVEEALGQPLDLVTGIKPRGVRPGVGWRDEVASVVEDIKAMFR